MELRKSYEFALKEAYNSLSKTTDQRLASCYFKYVEGEFIRDGFWVNNFSFQSRWLALL